MQRSHHHDAVAQRLLYGLIQSKIQNGAVDSLLFLKDHPAWECLHMASWALEANNYTCLVWFFQNGFDLDFSDRQ